MIYLISCLDKIKVGWTAQSFDDYLNWLQRRLPWRLDVRATRSATLEEEQEFHRENKDYRAEYGGNEWYPLDMFPSAREFMCLPEELSE
jgi:hypothetical protein